MNNSKVLDKVMKALDNKEDYEGTFLYDNGTEGIVKVKRYSSESNVFIDGNCVVSRENTLQLNHKKRHCRFLFSLFNRLTDGALTSCNDVWYIQGRVIKPYSHWFCKDALSQNIKYKCLNNPKLTQHKSILRKGNDNKHVITHTCNIHDFSQSQYTIEGEWTYEEIEYARVSMKRTVEIVFDHMREYRQQQRRLKENRVKNTIDIAEEMDSLQEVFNDISSTALADRPF